MDVSKFLSKVIGIYLFIVASAILFNMQQFAASINNLINNHSLMFVTGFFTLILGIVMVVSHNIWQWNWRVIITIIAWLSLLKGFSLIFFPQFIDKTSLLFLQNLYFAYLISIFDLLIGILLIYFGFKK